MAEAGTREFDLHETAVLHLAMGERWRTEKRLAIAPNQAQHFAPFETYFPKRSFLKAHRAEVAILK